MFVFFFFLFSKHQTKCVSIFRYYYIHCCFPNIIINKWTNHVYEYIGMAPLLIDFLIFNAPFNIVFWNVKLCYYYLYFMVFSKSFWRSSRWELSVFGTEQKVKVENVSHRYFDKWKSKHMNSLDEWMHLFLCYSLFTSRIYCNLTTCNGWLSF